MSIVSRATLRSFHYLTIITTRYKVLFYYLSPNVQYYMYGPSWGPLPVETRGTGPPPPNFRENQWIFNIYNTFLIILTLWPPQILNPWRTPWQGYIVIIHISKYFSFQVTIRIVGVTAACSTIFMYTTY